MLRHAKCSFSRWISMASAFSITRPGSRMPRLAIVSPRLSEYAKLRLLRAPSSPAHSGSHRCRRHVDCRARSSDPAAANARPTVGCGGLGGDWRCSRHGRRHVVSPRSNHGQSSEAGNIRSVGLHGRLFIYAQSNVLGHGVGPVGLGRVLVFRLVTARPGTLRAIHHPISDRSGGAGARRAVRSVFRRVQEASSPVALRTRS